MRAYKVVLKQGVEAAEGHTRVVWAGTQADARGARQNLMDAHDVKRSQVDLEEVDVPTDKAGLLAFLNENKVGA